jgi:hypothetical protein
MAVITHPYHWNGVIVTAALILALVAVAVTAEIFVLG